MQFFPKKKKKKATVPLLSSQSVLQVFDTTLRFGDDVLQRFGALQVIHLQTQVAILQTDTEIILGTLSTRPSFKPDI